MRHWPRPRARLHVALGSASINVLGSTIALNPVAFDIASALQAGGAPSASVLPRRRTANRELLPPHRPRTRLNRAWWRINREQWRLDREWWRTPRPASRPRRRSRRPRRWFAVVLGRSLSHAQPRTIGATAQRDSGCAWSHRRIAAARHRKRWQFGRSPALRLPAFVLQRLRSPAATRSGVTLGDLGRRERADDMPTSPLAGTPAASQTLVDIAKLVTAYYADRPDVMVREQRVAFGTSGHRGSLGAPANLQRMAHPCDHAMPSLAATGNSSTSTVRCFWGKTRTHCPNRRLPAHWGSAGGRRVSTLTDRLARGDYTPTPAISYAILTHNQGRTAGLCGADRDHAVAQSRRRTAG